MVTNQNVEQACAEVSRFSEEQMATEFDRFFKSQPSLCDFVVELTTDSDQKIQELALFLSYMVCKAMDVARPDRIPTIALERLEDAFRESESWIDHINRSDNSPVTLSTLTEDDEPQLMQYVISEINQPLDDGTQLDDEEKGEVFFVLKTVISSLSRSSFETTTEG